MINITLKKVFTYLLTYLFGVHAFLGAHGVDKGYLFCGGLISLTI